MLSFSLRPRFDIGQIDFVCRSHEHGLAQAFQVVGMVVPRQPVLDAVRRGKKFEASCFRFDFIFLNAAPMNAASSRLVISPIGFIEACPFAWDDAG